MRKRRCKYIVYTHIDFLANVFQMNRAYTNEERHRIESEIEESVLRFLDGERGTLFTYTFTGSDGKPHRAIEIEPLRSCNLDMIRKQRRNRRIL